MKQHITPQQLEELTQEQKEKLREWWKPQEGDLYVHINQIETVCRQCFFENNTITDEYIKNHVPLLSIGQIIEFLQDHEYFEENCDLIGEPLHTVCNLNWEFNEELCDALWSAVKETL